MRRLDKLFAALLLLVAILALPGTAEPAFADEEGIGLTVTRSGDTVTVAMVTTEDLSFGGVEGHFGFDDTAFSFESSQGGVLDTAVNVKNRMFSSDTGLHMTAVNGTELVILTYRITSGFSEDQSYEFSFDVEDAYSADLIYYDWSFDLHLSAVLEGNNASPTDPTEPVTPTDPTPPTEPVTPTDPTPPTEPVTPTDPTTPTEPVTPADPMNPSEPVSPVTPADPAHPTEPSAPRPHVITYKDGDGNVVFEITVEDGETLTGIDLPEEDEKWAVHGMEYDFNTPVEKDLTLVATKTDELLEAAVLTVELPAAEDETDHEYAFVLHFDGVDETEEFLLKSGEHRDFQMPVGTAYQLTVQGIDGTEITAQVDSDGEQQNDVKSAPGTELVVSSALGAGENRVHVTGAAVTTAEESHGASPASPFIWIAVAGAVLAAAGIAAVVIRSKKK